MPLCEKCAKSLIVIPVYVPADQMHHLWSLPGFVSKWEYERGEDRSGYEWGKLVTAEACFHFLGLPILP
jgi:hypothetical protein